MKNLTPAHARWCSAANHDMRWAIMPQQVLWRMRYYFKKEKPLVFREGKARRRSVGLRGADTFPPLWGSGGGCYGPIVGFVGRSRRDCRQGDGQQQPKQPTAAPCKDHNKVLAVRSIGPVAVVRHDRAHLRDALQQHDQKETKTKQGGSNRARPMRTGGGGDLRMLEGQSVEVLRRRSLRRAEMLPTASSG